eukprot:SM000037S13471  [mRNA]  locus=s37:28687:31822:- [translate_table: standard]
MALQALRSPTEALTPTSEAASPQDPNWRSDRESYPAAAAAAAWPAAAVKGVIARGEEVILQLPAQPPYGRRLGDSTEQALLMLVQAFHWESHKQAWWREVQKRVPDIVAAGFTAVWLPPSSESLAPQGTRLSLTSSSPRPLPPSLRAPCVCLPSLLPLPCECSLPPSSYISPHSSTSYLPRNLYSLESAYGSEAELRALLATLRASRLRSVADIVINHRCGTTQGEGGTYNRYDGVPMGWDETSVTSDTGGRGNASTGETFGGAANIDHTQRFVRDDLSAWLTWLRDDVGYSSFRFDFAKGYSVEFVRSYIEAARPDFAIGEYWDACNYSGAASAELSYDQDSHRQRIVDWVDRTGGLATAFDFTTKGILQEAVRSREYWRLRDPLGRPPGMLGIWPSRAVTFIDNHDTGSTQASPEQYLSTLHSSLLLHAHWPFPAEHISQGYTYILTHPGLPTVFYDHFFCWGDELRRVLTDLIHLRRKAGIHSRSSIRIAEASNDRYCAQVGDRLAMRIGADGWTPPAGGGGSGLWKLIVSGLEYAAWLRC